MARRPVMEGLYLLHFHGFIGNPDNRTGQASHYLGWSDDMLRRIRKHAMGTSDVKLMRAVFYAGMTFEVARIWPGADRSREFQLKRQGARSRLCLVCHPGMRLPVSAVPGEEFAALLRLVWESRIAA